MTANSIGPLVEQLRKDILLKSGYASVESDATVIPLYADWLKHFPFRKFPTGAVHEMIIGTAEERVASIGFLLGVVRQLLAKDKPLIWVSRQSGFYPAILTAFGISVDRFWGVQPKSVQELFWCTEEALRYGKEAIVVADLPHLHFKQSRRFQLAVEQSRATGFLLQEARAGAQTTACMTRWRVRSIPSEPIGSLPGVGFSAWRVALEKVRNGKPGSWDFYWQGNRLLEQKSSAVLADLPRIQTG